MRIVLRFIIGKMMWIVGLALVASYAGVLHPAGDSIAVFRRGIVVALAALSMIMLISGGRYRGFLGLVICAAAFLDMLPTGSQRSAGGEAIVVYQKNMLVLTDRTNRLEQDIRDSGADIVMLQEVHPRNQSILNDLRDAYPFQHICPYILDGSLAVLSKWSADGPVLPCQDNMGLAAMRIDTGRHRLWVASVHLRWPWPYDQADQIKVVTDQISGLAEPLVIAGDFNMVHWSYGLRRMARSAGVRLAGAAGPTFDLPDVPISLPIDHVYMPNGARAARSEPRPAFGSDHKGVVATFELP